MPLTGYAYAVLTRQFEFRSGTMSTTGYAYAVFARQFELRGGAIA
ncbi:hypothetical protein [Nostoc flagelliforme]|nr:hypothetical protein [Nostoc flagelliforme]